MNFELLIINRSLLIIILILQYYIIAIIRAFYFNIALLLIINSFNTSFTVSRVELLDLFIYTALAVYPIQAFHYATILLRRNRTTRRAKYSVYSENSPAKFCEKAREENVAETH